jgi:hypothetical protein
MFFAQLHVVDPVGMVGKVDDALPESDSLPSAWRFAECFLSGTQQIPVLGTDRVYREQDSRHRNTLGKKIFTECQTLGERRRSANGRQQQLTAIIFAECQTTDTRQSMLCRVPFLDTR